MVTSHIHIVIAHEHFNSLGMIRSLGEMNVPVHAVLIGYPSKMILASKYIQQSFFVQDSSELVPFLLEKYAAEQDKPFIYVGNDRLAELLDLHYDQLAGHFYFFHAGEQGRISHLLSKKVQNDLAVQAGFNVPTYEVVQTGDLPRKVDYPLITKAVDSRADNWKAQTFICRNETELLAAYAHIDSPQVMLQQYIEKENETGFDALSIQNGEVVYSPLQLSYFSNTATSFGSSIYFFRPTDDDLCRKVSEIMRLTGFSGVFSIDFLIGKDGKVYFLEINFRNSAWSYPSTSAGVNLLYIWACSTLKGALDLSSVQIKKLPFVATVEFEEMRNAWRKGLWHYLKACLHVLKSDCLIYWNRRDNGPFRAYMSQYSERASWKLHRILRWR